MSGLLTIHVNRDRYHAIDPDSAAFETTGGFSVRLQNHGEAVHVHLALEGDLAGGGRLPDANHYVEANSAVDVPIEIGTDLRPATGRLEIVTGYGAETESVDVTVVDDPGASVGPEVTEPTSTSTTRSTDSSTPIDLTGTAPLVVLALAAIALAGGVVTLIDSPVVLAGAVFVIATAVGGVLYVLYRNWRRPV